MTADEGETPQPARRRFFGGRERLLEAARYSLWVFLSVRIGLTVVALMAISVIPSNPPVDVPGRPAPGASGGWSLLWTVWERHDALWYLRIAESGYEMGDGSAAFFPAYALVVKVVSFLTFGSELAAALIVSNAAFYASLVLLHLMAHEERSPLAARRALVYLAAFPAAVVLLVPYSEAFFLFVTLVAFRAARQGRWPVAGAAGAVAAATRSLGLLVAVGLAVEAFQQARERGLPLMRAAPAVAWSALTAAGTLAYLAYWWVKAGNPLVPMTAQGQWGREATVPLLTPIWATTRFFSALAGDASGLFLFDWVVVLPMLAVAGWGVTRLRWGYSAYVWASLLVPLTFVWEPRPFMSMPRFVLVLFPLFWLMADATAGRRGRHEALVVASAGLAGFAAALFVQWYFVF